MTLWVPAKRRVPEATSGTVRILDAAGRLLREIAVPRGRFTCRRHQRVGCERCAWQMSFTTREEG